MSTLCVCIHAAHIIYIRLYTWQQCVCFVCLCVCIDGHILASNEYTYMHTCVSVDAVPGLSRTSRDPPVPDKPTIFLDLRPSTNDDGAALNLSSQELAKRLGETKKE